MGKRGVVTDYGGEELYRGDLVAYAARQGNRVRMADAIVDRVTTRLVDGRLRPMLRIRPTGTESGFAKRRSLRKEWITSEHVRLIIPDVTGERDQ
ncbi:hypothetical protein GCM10010245_85780 [Streptomyces spectabilis]|uniref:Uncharacterized protein n=1 Tax=Streptomyces spectabilis TaxID=68270 RepID=A0A5P2XBM2_STRST|nr:hypothetical protein [Streptomyces spectabilis]QEV59862.1 hypothetical protein CP982_14875 [Streptomyces spectabilis]GGR71264.1 hypothetical protein GCM10010252_06960 [Streptomyces aureoverticillatus]GGV54275.1 hypothetical protein GCM10010245_85780 [Streptomyces spectabilis]